jgi:hypothetical protein
MWSKKLSRVAVALSSLLLSAAAMAGSPGQEKNAEEPQATVSQVSLYGGIMMGGYYRNMQNGLLLAGAVKLSGNQPISTSWDQGQAGFSLGIDLGYQFTDELSLELGTFYMQPQTLNFTSGSGSNSSGTYCNTIYCYANGSYTRLSTWTTYVGIKAQIELIRQLSVFTKLAAAYVDSRYRIHLASGSVLVAGGTAAGDSATNSTYWAPAIALGAEYRLTETWRVSAQYMLVLNGNTLYNDPATVNSAISTINDIAQRSIQLFTVGAEYRFLT